MNAKMHLLWILPWALLAIYLGSARFLGGMAPSRTKRLLDAGLGGRDFRVWNDIDLGTDRGRTHYDHVVISRTGIHVVDSLHVSGHVKGTDVQSRWKTVTAWRTREFDNPVYANHLRIQALAQVLELPLSRFQGLIVLNGHFRLSDAAPGNVIAAEKLVGRLRARAPEVFTAEQIDRIAQGLQEARNQSPGRRRIVVWKLIQVLLSVGLLAATAIVFSDSLGEILARLQVEMAGLNGTASAEQAAKTSSGGRKGETGLICAYSADTDRCACHEPGGGKVEIELHRCRELAERGSVLKN